MSRRDFLQKQILRTPNFWKVYMQNYNTDDTNV